MLLHQLIDSVAASDPERTAVHFEDEVISFADLSARSVDAAIAVAGVTGPGDRVAIIGENHPSWLECYYGVPRAGRILVFLNHRLAPAELASILHRSGASLLIGPASSIVSDHLPPNSPRSGAPSTWTSGHHCCTRHGTGNPTHPLRVTPRGQQAKTRRHG